MESAGFSRRCMGMSVSLRVVPSSTGLPSKRCPGQACLSITNTWRPPKLRSIESMMPSNHLILCHPLLFPPSVFPASGSFQMSQFFTSGGQSTGVSASASVLPMNIQDWFPLRWTSWISLQSTGLSRVFSNTTVQKRQYLLLLKGLFLSDFTFLQHFYASPLKFYEKVIRISIVYLPKNKIGSENNTVIITLVLSSYHEQ